MRWLAAASLLICAGCRSAMTTTIENNGDPLDVHYLCGDAMYDATIPTGGHVTWSPVANSCHLDVSTPTKGRDFSLKNDCRSSHGCSVGVTFPVVGPKAAPTSRSATLTGTGYVDVAMDVATVGP